jgi:hypothetical protein
MTVLFWLAQGLPAQGLPAQGLRDAAARSPGETR